MTEVYGPVVTFSDEPAAFADRVGRSIRRHLDQTHAAAEVARMQAQRRQAAQKEGSMTRQPSISIPWAVPSATPPAGGLDPAERRHLLSATAYGRAILKEEDAARPAQFAEEPLSDDLRRLLSATHYGRQALAERDRRSPKPAMFAETPEQDATIRTMLAGTAFGRQILREQERDQRMHASRPALFANPALREVTVRDLESVDRLAPYVKTPADAEDIARMIASGGHPWWVIQSMQTVLRAVCRQKGIAVPSMSSAA